MAAEGAAAAAAGGGAPARLGRHVSSVDEAAAALRAGQLVAFPTETVYGLGAHAMDAAAVASVFTTKGRPRSDPLIVHVACAEDAEALVELDERGMALMRRLAAAFWPGPLTLVAPACAALPSAVTAGSGFVGVRIPAHARALDLLRAAAVPVAAPSANRFGHVSPTRPEHVMDDLGAHPILVLSPDERADNASAPPCCEVGIESTVIKLDTAASQLVLLRRGGVPESELERWLDAEPTGFTLRRQRTHTDTAAAVAGESAAATGGEAAAQAPPPHGATDGGDEGGGTVAPGMLLTHYSPDLPAYLVAGARGAPGAPSAPRGATATAFTTSSAVVLDFGGRLARLKGAAHAYRDLSPLGDAAEAATRVFEALRWSEEQAAGGGRVVLLPNLTATEKRSAGATARSAERVPALADRLFRAASGQTARLSADDADVVVDAPLVERRQGSEHE